MRDFNVIARRQSIAFHAQELMDAEHNVAHDLVVAGADAARLAILTGRLGEVATAVWLGHTDLEGELLHLIATASAWLEHIEASR